MNCYYCDKIIAVVPTYSASTASHDLGSEAPRCQKHWRYMCGKCGHPAHFMATAYCATTDRFFCAACAADQREVPGDFWAWRYHVRYRSPWSGEWCEGLDRLEYGGNHPIDLPQTASGARQAISQEAYLIRYPPKDVQWRSQGDFSDPDVQANWNRNAVRWTAKYDDDGDRNRRYQSDEPMLAMLGKVKGLRILDVGSGNGYLCRKLARNGARITGVELSDEFLRQALEREEQDRLGITYHHGSASRMDFIPDHFFDKVVSNYVLMDVRDYERALSEIFRVLAPGGLFVAVISHPCFASGPAGWAKPALDSPRAEDRTAWRSDLYFQRGPYLGQWGDLDPVLSFHRPLRDYWQAFQEIGFVIDGFEEPSITERGRREMSPARVEQSLRVPYSCIFRLVKPT